MRELPSREVMERNRISGCTRYAYDEVVAVAREYKEAEQRRRELLATAGRILEPYEEQGIGYEAHLPEQFKDLLKSASEVTPVLAGGSPRELYPVRKWESEIVSLKAANIRLAAAIAKAEGGA